MGVSLSGTMGVAASSVRVDCAGCAGVATTLRFGMNFVVDLSSHD